MWVKVHDSTTVSPVTAMASTGVPGSFFRIANSAKIAAKLAAALSTTSMTITQSDSS